MRIIDAHCHLGQGCAYSLSADELLREMDANGVSKAIIVPVDRCLAVHNREGNDMMLDEARAHPDRFIAFATANPWYGQAALDELRRAFDAGAAGLKLHPVLQGFSIIDEVGFPLIELAVEQRKPIYFHTGTPVHSTPFQLTEVATRYPNGIFIMGHAAYSDYWNDVIASAKAAPNIFIETSQHLASFLRVLVRELGAGRFIYGSDAPKTSMPVEIEKITRYITAEDDLQAMFAGNVLRLLGGAA